jgi:hypothetical protein
MQRHRINPPETELERAFMNDPNRQDTRSMALRVLEWIKSAGAKQAMAESERRVRETEKLLAKGREIDPSKLHEPFTR